jgi:hypothetical protein
LYGLVAAQRAANGGNALYDMSDGKLKIINDKLEIDGLPGKNADVKKVPVTLPGATFPDIKTHVNKAAIEALAVRGIVGGDGGLFAPDATVTRAQFAKIVTFSLGLPEYTTSVFTDVPSDEWYTKPVGTAYYYEIVQGTSAATFNPGGTITRQEAAVMVARAAKLCGLDTALDAATIRDTLAQFGDYKSVDEWALSALAFCYSQGILDDSEFNIQPKIAIKRCEIAEMVYRMLDKSELL